MHDKQEHVRNVRSAGRAGRVPPYSAAGRGWRLLVLVAVLLGPLASASWAQDPENCLACHRFRGLGRLEPETGELRLFFCSAEYYAYRQGPHARVRCTECHERSEVAVIPHKVKTPVNCTKTCHITQATGVERRFSHLSVEESLSHSAHAPDKLADLGFDPPLLRPGQSTCLYCHDQPTFGESAELPAGFLCPSGGTRCDTCHEQELPLEIDYFAKHISARLKPSRSVKQTAQVCAVCHSNSQIIERFGGHDVVASYLHSFHGKASLLGSTDTATCVDCHSSGRSNQHLMLSRDVPESSTHPEQLVNTCRTTACHASAAPAMSGAAVHMEIDPTQGTLESMVAAFFILLTAAVMAVFFLMVILELLDAALRPHVPEHGRLVKLARRLQAHPEGRRLLERMTVHQRLQHWGMVIPFALLVLTGMPLKFAEAEWSSLTVAMFGGLTIVRAVHRIAGVALIAVFFYHVGYLLVRLVMRLRREGREGVRTPIWKIVLGFPLMLTPRDGLQFLQLMAYLVHLRRERPRFGRFNFNQKFEYWAVFWGMPVMGLSGLALWAMPTVAEHLSGRALNFAFIIHSDEAYLAFIYIAAIHLFTVIFSPAVFPVSGGTLTGQAPPAELVECHREELEDVARQVGVEWSAEEAHKSGSTAFVEVLKGGTRRFYSLVVAGGYCALAFFSLRFLVLLLVTRQAAPVEIVDIPTRLDADAFFAATVLRTEHQSGVTERPRGPLAHFHQIPQWFQADPGNSCTTEGCHLPLPHGERIEVRAFLNMHATFVDCMVCHTREPLMSLEAKWFSLADRQRSGTPPILRLAARLETLLEIEPQDAVAIAEELKILLREALPSSGNSRQLQKWLLRLETTHPRNQAWNDIIADMRSGIDMHVHGEYGAKIGLFDGEGLVGEPTAERRAEIHEYLRRRRNASESGVPEAPEMVCRQVTRQGAMCVPCHSAEPSLIDPAALGYSPARVEELGNSAVMRSILRIEQGQPFHLPLDRGEEGR